MRGFLLLFRRDLQQRWMLFVASFAMGLFIAAIPLLRGSRLSPAELRGAAGLTAALVWCAVLAILLGGSIFTRDLTENRLAFDFRLPVRPGAIWAARLLAAVTTIAIAAAFVLAPSAVAGMDFTGAAAGFDVLLGIGDGGQGVPSHTGLTFAPLAILALLLLANPIALATRARQAWAGFDMLSFALIGLAGYWSWETLRPWEARSAVWWTTAVLIATTLVGTAAASLLQVARGRTETDKAQRRLSIGLLGTALLAFGAATGYSQWLTHPNLEDLAGNAATAQSLGPDWVVIQGPTRRDYQVVARFLLAPAKGRAILLGPLPQRMWPRRSAAHSIDGSVIAWLDSYGQEADGFRLFRLSTTDSKAKPEPTPVTVSSRIVNFALSPDGTAIAALERLGRYEGPMRVVVSKLADGDVTAAIQITSCRLFGDMLFVSAKEVVIPCGFPSYSDVRSEPTYLVRVDLEKKELRLRDYFPERPPQLDRSLGLIGAASGWLSLAERREGELTVGWNVLEPETGRKVADLALEEPLRDPYARGRQLRDRSFAIAAANRSGSSLLHFSLRGDLETTVVLPQGTSRILAESADAKCLVVATVAARRDGPPHEFYSLVDLGTGTAKAMMGGLHIQDWYGALGSNHTVLYGPSGRLLWFNPQSKVLQPLLSDAQYFEEGLPTGSSS